MATASSSWTCSPPRVSCTLILLLRRLHWQPRYLFPFISFSAAAVSQSLSHLLSPFRPLYANCMCQLRGRINYRTVANAQFSVALPVWLSYILRADFLRLVPLSRHNNEGREIFGFRASQLWWRIKPCGSSCPSFRKRCPALFARLL